MGATLPAFAPPPLGIPCHQPAFTLALLLASLFSLPPLTLVFPPQVHPLHSFLQPSLNSHPLHHISVPRPPPRNCPRLSFLFPLVLSCSNLSTVSIGPLLRASLPFSPGM